MMDDRYCLSLYHVPGMGGAFTYWLDKLDLKLPSELSVEECVRLGWITPRKRIRLPDAFASQRPDRFHGRNLEIPEEDAWALQLWSLVTSSWPEEVLRPDLNEEEAWDIPFLDADHDFSRLLRQHEIPTGPGTDEPYAGQDPWGHPIPAWIDLFGWWQAYELYAMLESTRLFAAPRNVASAREDLQGTLERFDEYRKYSDSRIAGEQRAWKERRSLFEWLGAYRTLYGLWAERDFSVETRQTAAKRLACRMGLTRDSLCTDIRDVLLRLWRDTTWQSTWKHLPARMREAVRQDVAYAIECVYDISGTPVDPYADFWDPPDRLAREWARLPDVLPYEAPEAREDFPERVQSYLEQTNQVLAAPYDEERVRTIVRGAWRSSWTLRRFLVAFRRLHEHYGGGINREFRVRLVYETPMEFLAQCALFTEKLMNTRYLERTGAAELDLFVETLGWLASQVEARLGVPGLMSTMKGRVRAEAQFHALPRTKTLPFLEPRTRTGPTARRDVLVEAFVNFAKLRNYTAHHDALDEELLDVPVAGTMVEGMLLVFLLILET